VRVVAVALRRHWQWTGLDSREGRRGGAADHLSRVLRRAAADG